MVWESRFFVWDEQFFEVESVDSAGVMLKARNLFPGWTVKTEVCKPMLVWDTMPENQG